MQVVNTLSTLMGRLKENNFDHVVQWFQSSRTPPSAHLVCLSYRFRCLFYLTVSVL